MADQIHEEHKAEQTLMEKIADKIHHHHHEQTTPSHSDSEDDKKTTSSPPVSFKYKVRRIFGREKTVHIVFGGGRPADVFLWRNKKISAGVLGGATAIWFLFEVVEYQLLTLLCHGFMLALAILFLWSNACTFINKSAPRIPEVYIPEEPVLKFVSALRNETNRAFAVLREIESGRDLKKFLLVMAGFWILSIVGSYCDFLTLIYITVVVLHTVPVLYEKYEDQVDSFAEKAMEELKKLYAVFDAMVLSKIPRWPLKDRKMA